MPLDPEVANWLAENPAGLALEQMSVAEARQQMEDSSRLLVAGQRAERVVDLAASGPGGEIPLRLYASGTTPRPVVVYYHGGGWVMGSIETHDAFCHDLAVTCQANVISVDYRRAPEHPFPAAVEDAYAAASWIAEREAEFHAAPGHLFVAGDSAGGNLAATTTLLARERRQPEIAGQVLIYPIVDHDFETESYLQHAEGYHLTRGAMQWFWEHYVPNPERRDDPLASPLRADSLADLPPALVLTAQYDPLRDEGDTYARRLRAAGNRVQWHRYDGTIHGFIRRQTWSKTQLAMRAITAFLHEPAGQE